MTRCELRLWNNSDGQEWERLLGRNQPDVVTHVRYVHEHAWDTLTQAELINIFEIFLPQLLRYPNPADPLNGEAAALLMRDPKSYNKKVEEYVSRFASPEDADQAGDDDDDTDDEAVVSNGRAKAKANGGPGNKAGAVEEEDDEDEVMSDMGEMSDDEAAGDMEL